jgi:DDE superfamily endonuclease
MWCIPPEKDAAFVCAMEDVLEVYERPYDSDFPVICLDEASKQILSELRAPLPAQPEQVKDDGRVSPAVSRRVDNEYKREGTCSLFMVFEPLAGKRKVFVRQQRTAVDYAQVIKVLCDEMYPDAKKIVLVQDNLNTHGPESLYKAFAPAEALRLKERIEWHHTPKHGSWLNMAETELSVLAGQCLEERMGSLVYLSSQVAAWERSRNLASCRVDWQFRTADARIKLKRLYPVILTK